MNDLEAVSSGRTLFVVCVALWLTGCGGGNLSSSSPTPKEQLAALEASGAIPVLDREPTLAGIDSNANGVRDDIERYIESTYTDALQRKAATQTAQDYQRMLLVNPDDEAEMQVVIDSGARAASCAFEVFGGLNGFRQSYQMSRDIESMTTNTKVRLEAYLDFNRGASGSVLSSPKGNACD